ncbi:MAG: hypothetical protein AMXMBFR84_45460 [Candidatus Hydrogenedentota bacterium]
MLKHELPDKLRVYRFKLDRILGRGGTGVVYRGIDTEKGDVVAIKLFHKNFFRNKLHIKDYARSVARFSKWNHPNVVLVHEFLDGEEGPCQVMEYVDGPDLKWYLDNQPFDLQQRLGIISQVCNGLQYIHDQGFTHHDLKPANVLFTRKGVVKMSDYSLSRQSLFAFLDVGGSIAEQITPMYVAPEIIRKEPASPQSDMYSLGITLYFMFTGKMPFEVDNLTALYACHLRIVPNHPSTVNRRCPEQLGNIIMKMLNKDPKQRFESCDQLRIALSNIAVSRI